MKCAYPECQENVEGLYAEGCKDCGADFCSDHLEEGLCKLCRIARGGENHRAREFYQYMSLQLVWEDSQDLVQILNKCGDRGWRLLRMEDVELPDPGDQRLSRGLFMRKV